MGKNNGTVLDIPVEFGGVSIGEATARLGIRANRSVLNLAAADEVFCGHRLTGRVVLGGSDDQPGQGRIVDDLDHQVDGTFDCKRIGVTQEQISTGLTFSLADVDVRELAKFSKGTGRLIVEGVGELPEEADDDAVQTDAPGTLKAEGPWRDVLLDTLFHGALLKSLNKAGLVTVGNLADFSASEQRLTDLEGIGPGKAAQIEDRMLQFWEQNPDADKLSEQAAPDEAATV